MDFVLTEGRSEVVAQAQQDIQLMLDNYQTGLVVTSVNLVEAQPPEEVQGAFSDAIKAREDEQRLKNEAEAYSNEIIPKARGAASRIVQEAEGYRERVIAEAEGDASRFTQLLKEYEKAPQLTRKRLYLETMEEVLGNANKVIMDVEGGNNLMYLPLDKIINMQDVTKTDSSASSRFEIPASSSSTSDTRSTTRGRDGRGR
jgi:membrane protease subunit HflK